MTTFAVTLRLIMEASETDRRAHFERVADSYAAVEAADAQLLDCSWTYADREAHAEVDVDLTVEAVDETAAYRVADRGVRAAIRDAGGITPSAGGRPTDSDAVVFRIRDESVALLLA